MADMADMDGMDGGMAGMVGEVELIDLVDTVDKMAVADMVGADDSAVAVEVPVLLTKYLLIVRERALFRSILLLPQPAPGGWLEVDFLRNQSGIEVALLVDLALL